MNDLPRGMVFDMDGVLLDSEPFICRAACLMFAERGLAVRPEDFLPFVGAGENRYLGGVAEKYGFSIEIDEVKKRTYDIYLQIIRGRLRALPGVTGFLAACRRAGKKLALATSADRRKAEGNLREIGLPWSSFDAVVTGEDVVHKKPDPEIFATAAARLGLAAGQAAFRGFKGRYRVRAAAPDGRRAERTLELPAPGPCVLTLPAAAGP